MALGIDMHFIGIAGKERYEGSEVLVINDNSLPIVKLFLQYIAVEAAARLLFVFFSRFEFSFNDGWYKWERVNLSVGMVQSYAYSFALVFKYEDILNCWVASQFFVAVGPDFN